MTAFKLCCYEVIPKAIVSTTADAKMLKHVFRYLKGTSEYCLCYTKSTNGLQITACCDADWAASKDRKSISGYCGLLV